MNLVNNFKTKVLQLQNMKSFEIAFVVVLILYLVSNVSTPYDLAPHINNVYMYVSLFAIVILLSLNTNPLIALLFALLPLFKG
jgi:hypothetical protein